MQISKNTFLIIGTLHIFLFSYFILYSVCYILSHALYEAWGCWDIPANTRHYTNDVLMLGQRRRRWLNNKSTLD